MCTARRRIGRTPAILPAGEIRRLADAGTTIAGFHADLAAGAAIHRGVAVAVTHDRADRPRAERESQRTQHASPAAQPRQRARQFVEPVPVHGYPFRAVFAQIIQSFDIVRGDCGGYYFNSISLNSGMSRKQQLLAMRASGSVFA